MKSMLLCRIWPYHQALSITAIKMQLLLQSHQLHLQPHPTLLLAPPLAPSLTQMLARQAVLVTRLCLVLTLACLDKVRWTGVVERVHLLAPQANSCRAIVPRHVGRRSAFLPYTFCRKAKLSRCCLQISNLCHHLRPCCALRSFPDSSCLSVWSATQLKSNSTHIVFAVLCQACTCLAATQASQDDLVWHLTLHCCQAYFMRKVRLTADRN